MNTFEQGIVRAIEEDDPESIRANVAAGGDPNFLYNGEIPIIFKAVADGSLRVVQKLVQMGADLRAPYVVDGEARTVLAYAVINERPEMVEYLIEKGIEDRMAVNFAVYIEEPHNIEILNILFQHNFNPNIRSSIDGTTPLHAAQDLEDPLPVVQLLLANGADPRIKDAENEKPVVYFIEEEMQDIVKLLQDRERQLWDEEYTLQRRAFVMAITDGQKLDVLPSYILESNREWLFTTGDRRDEIEFARNKLMYELSAAAARAEREKRLRQQR